MSKRRIFNSTVDWIVTYRYNDKIEKFSFKFLYLAQECYYKLQEQGHSPSIHEHRVVTEEPSPDL